MKNQDVGNRQDDRPLITVAGATSKQGRSVVASLLQDGHYRVRALTRKTDSPQAQLLRKAGAELWEIGQDPDYRPDGLIKAFEGSAGAFLMTPPSLPGQDHELLLGRQLADAAAVAGVGHIVFSTLENVEQRSGGTKYAPHFTDKAKVADHIRGLGVSHTFVMLAFFYTNLLEYYVPGMRGDTLLMPIYLPEDFRAPFVDPLTATGPAVREIFSDPARYQGRAMPVVSEMISPREMVETFQRVTGQKAEYRNAYTRGGLLQHFPQFADNPLLVEELLGMVSHAVEHGYFDASRDLEWSRKVAPDMLDWEGFLRRTGWRGQQQSFGGQEHGR